MGIGTTTPTHELNVVGSGNFTNDIFLSGSTAGGNFIKMNNGEGEVSIEADAGWMRFYTDSNNIFTLSKAGSAIFSGRITTDEDIYLTGTNDFLNFNNSEFWIGVNDMGGFGSAFIPSLITNHADGLAIILSDAGGTSEFAILDYTQMNVVSTIDSDGNAQFDGDLQLDGILLDGNGAETNVGMVRYSDGTDELYFKLVLSEATIAALHI